MANMTQQLNRDRIESGIVRLLTTQGALTLRDVAELLEYTPLGIKRRLDRLVSEGRLACGQAAREKGQRGISPLVYRLAQ